MAMASLDIFNNSNVSIFKGHHFGAGVVCAMTMNDLFGTNWSGSSDKVGPVDRPLTRMARPRDASTGLGQHSIVQQHADVHRRDE